MLRQLRSNTLALLVTTSADVAELVATTAGHVIATFIFLHPEATLSTAFSSNSLRPLLKLLILRQNLIIDFIGSPLNMLLIFFARLLHVIHCIALEAILDTACWALMIALFFTFFDVKIVASIRWALLHTRVLISNLLPFKFRASLHLLFREKLL